MKTTQCGLQNGRDQSDVAWVVGYCSVQESVQILHEEGLYQQNNLIAESQLNLGSKLQVRLGHLRQRRDVLLE